MKGIIALCCLVLVAAAHEHGDDKDHYTTQWDNVDVDEVLSNDRILSNYIACCLETGPCTPDANALKSNLSDALKTMCAKCSDAQKKGSKKVMKHLINKRPDDWAKLRKKYDENGEYADKYEKELRELIESH